MNSVKLLRNALIFLAILLCLAAGLPALERAKVGAQAEDPAAQAEALLALSEQQNSKDHALALQTAQQALGLWQGLANREGMARAYAHIGQCYFAQSDLPEAILNYDRSLELWRDLNRPQEQADVLTMLGFIENRKGEWSNAISLYTRARALIDEQNEPSRMAKIVSGFADIFNESGLPENGLIQYQQALAYARQTSRTHDDTMATWAIGSTYYLLEDYPLALTHLQQALAEFPAGSVYVAICNEYLGRVYSAMGDRPVALEHLQAALDIYTQASNPKEAARVRGLMGQIYQQQGKVELAQQNYQQALTSFRLVDDRINQAVIYYALGQLALSRGNDNEAEDYLRQSIDVTENLRRVSTSSDLTAAFIASIYERYEKYIECLMRKHQAEPARGFAVRAFETSELARGRSLAELLRANGTNFVHGLDPELAAQEKRLRQLLRVKEDYKVKLLGRAHKKQELDTLEAELASLEGEYKQVSETIKARYPSYVQVTKPAAWNLQQIQEQVIADDQTVLLEYSLGADQSYVWAITRDSIKSYTLPSRTLLNQAAQKAYKLLATMPSPDLEKALTPALQELSRLVLSPIAAELNKPRIIIVPDGALHYIPFQVLPVPASANEPLIARYEIINTPSASILGELRKEARQRQPTKVLAAFGDPEFAPNYAQGEEASNGEQSANLQALEMATLQSALRDIELNGEAFDPSAIQRLFYAKRELANLRDAASGGEAFIASGVTASREELLRTDLTQYAILHFATHGLLDPKRPENSGLVLSTVNRDGQPINGFVGLQDIYGLRAPVDLVVLSACQTALGKNVRGEGLLGLTRGFMYAGASSVIASLWKVHDEATAELMREAYANMLQKGMTPAASLREAQNSIRQRPEWQAPYYWAGFTLQGEYRQVIKPITATGATKPYRKIIISGAMMLLAGLALWYYYRRRKISREHS